MVSASGASEEITWSYGWDYWLHHSRGELQLFAWKCYCNDQDVQAMSENEYDLFSWVTDLNLQYSFAGYLGLSSDDASQIVPSTYRP
jgi:hypothetical protein